MNELSSKAERIASNWHLRLVLSLVISGVPYDLAESMEIEELWAWNIIVGELKSGKKYDWATERWIEQQ